MVSSDYCTKLVEVLKETAWHVFSIFGCFLNIPEYCCSFFVFVFCSAPAPHSAHEVLLIFFSLFCLDECSPIVLDGVFFFFVFTSIFWQRLQREAEVIRLRTLQQQQQQQQRELYQQQQQRAQQQAHLLQQQQLQKQQQQQLLEQQARGRGYRYDNDPVTTQGVFFL